IRAYAEKEFSICSMAEKYTRVYRQVIATRQRVPARGRSVDWARAGIIPIPTPNDASASPAAQSGSR
ncbi:MAG: hypothetical protein J2P36_09290, partial [Ktedonobacteraceae bacterium]|nr:hypothetical protein [Ktedonobacteraceae bacterium]